MPARAAKKNELRKAVEAVHSSSSLGLLANKLLNVFVLNAFHELATKETYRISVSEAAELCGFNSNNTKLLKDAARELKNEKIEWGDIGKETSWGITSFLSEVKIENGIIEYSIPPTIRKLFILGEGKSWALLNLDYIAIFRSLYTLKLYENCVRYKGTGSTGARPVAEWRRRLHAQAKLYDEFRYFRQIIDQAIKELNETTDIHVTADYLRVGRSVESICFYVTSSQKPISLAGLDNEVLRRICALGVPERTARKYIADYEAEYLEGNLALVEERYKDGIITKNPPAYLKRALEEDFRRIKTGVEIERELEVTKRIAAEEDVAAKEKLEQEKTLRRMTEAKERFDTLTPDEQDALVEEFSEHIQATNSFLYKQIRKTGIDGPLVSPSFKQWLADKFES